MNSDKAKITKNKKGFTTNFMIGDSLFFQERGIVYVFVAKSLHVGNNTFQIYNGYNLRSVDDLFVSQEGAERDAHEYRKQDLLAQIESHKADINRINEKLSNGDF